MMRLCGSWTAGLAALGLFAASFAGLQPARADDVLNNEARITQALTKYGLSGEGVVVAILDTGIDWQNFDFRNPDGTTRIAYIFDLTDDTGMVEAGNTYGMGTIHTRTEINDALQGGAQIDHRDAIGRGTATAGICCGNGRNVPKYVGVAQKSTIVMIKVVAGASAHDGQPAEPAFFDLARVGVGLKFARDKAAELGMPLVVLSNFGTVGGPGDGTSNEVKNIDAIAGNGKLGVVYVQGSSNDGGHPNHAEGTVAQGATENVTFTKSGGQASLEVWYRDTDRFSFTLSTPNGTFGPFAGPNGNDTADPLVSNAQFIHGHEGSGLHNNSKRKAYFTLTGAGGLYTLRILGTTVEGTGAWQASISPSRYWESTAVDNQFTSHIVPGYTINDASSSRNAVVPNSYVYRKTWIDLGGNTITVPDTEGVVGDLWKGSGIGPTWDGRTGIDFSVPGEHSFGTLAPLSTFAINAGNKVRDGGGQYTAMNSVSAANPVAAGVAALMLQKEPRLDGQLVKQILQRTARVDTFTGTVPNTRWGYGKLDALAALDDVHTLNAGQLLSSVLPYARSVQVGQVASGFGVMINTGVQIATGCEPAAPYGGVPATFSYQTTNASNQLTGTPNTPANIGPGASQNFFFSYTPTAAFPATEIPLIFDCGNRLLAPSTNGVNTFILSASTTPQPDMLAIAATASGDGILSIPGATGSTSMAAAAINIGAAGEITASVDTGGKTLPVNIVFCQSNAQAQCLAPPASTLTFNAAANTAMTFSIFATGTGAIPFDPANNRMFLRFKTGDGVTRGATNVAIRTQ